MRSLCLFILRLRFFLTLSAHTSADPPLTSSSPIGSRHGRIWRPGWKERRASRRLGVRISPGAEPGRGGAAAGEGVCWICGARRVSNGMAGSDGGSRRRRRSLRSGAAAAAIGDVQDSGTRAGFLSIDAMVWFVGPLEIRGPVSICFWRRLALAQNLFF